MSQRTVRWVLMGGLLTLAVAAGGIAWSRRATPLASGTYAGQPWSGNSLAIPFRWCPPGTFMMGSPATEPGRIGDHEFQVRVTLTHGFWLGQTEVTQGQWQSVMGTTPCKGKYSFQEGANCPAVWLSHSGDPDSAEAFCETFTTRERAAGRLPHGWKYRLPTEAEWEHACRAGTTTAYGFGDDVRKLGQYAWFEDNSKRDLWRTDSWLEDHTLYAHPVGTKAANAWGLRDMHGSVWEWCADGYERKLSGGEDPQAAAGGQYRVFRGGSWYNAAWESRSASRNRHAPQYRMNHLGFRLTLSPTGQSAEP